MSARASCWKNLLLCPSTLDWGSLSAKVTVRWTRTEADVEVHGMMEVHAIRKPLRSMVLPVSGLVWDMLEDDAGKSSQG